MKRNSWLLAGGFIAGVWIVALGAIHFMHAQIPTAVSVSAWIDRQDWAALTPEERDKRLNELADQMNRLSLAERQKLESEHALEAPMHEMTEEERLRFLDLTLPKGFAQMMDAFNKMTPDQRHNLVTRALDGMKNWDPDQKPPGWDDAVMQKVVQSGFSSYLQDASAETKLDLAPLIQQVQVVMQGVRN